MREEEGEQVRDKIASTASEEGLEDHLAVPNADPGKPVFAADGTDLTLIREMLAKTPEERLRTLEAVIDSINRLRDAVET